MLRREHDPGDPWDGEFERWLAPFLAQLGNKAQRRWCPVYLHGLLAPGERKSIEPIAARVAKGQSQQLHHFVTVSAWDTAVFESLLLEKADALVGGAEAHLIIDDTALVKKGTHSVGVAHQYCGQLGKNANCQALVSLTLARDEVPVPIALRLYLPKAWATDRARCDAAGVPQTIAFRTKWKIALDEIERVRRAGVAFGDVLADAGYGACREFREGLSAMGLTWAVGISPDQLVYPEGTTLDVPASTRRTGRPRTLAAPSAPPRKAREAILALGPAAFHTVSWRKGTKGPLTAAFAALRIRVADGPNVLGHRHGPGASAWLVCERRNGGETKYYLTNHRPDESLLRLASAIKARWSCEQAHQQLKEELGLDHFEGRSWNGLHRHALLAMIAFAFLQHLRCTENKAAAQQSTALPVVAGNSAPTGSTAGCA